MQEQFTQRETTKGQMVYASKKLHERASVTQNGWYCERMEIHLRQNGDHAVSRASYHRPFTGSSWREIVREDPVFLQTLKGAMGVVNREVDSHDLAFGFKPVFATFGAPVLPGMEPLVRESAQMER